MIGYAGLSHLGIVSAAAGAAKGFPVLGYDPDAALVGRLNRGDLPLFEPGLAEQVTQALREEKLSFTSVVSDLTKCDVVYISSDVPTDDEGRSDLRPIQELFRSVAAVAPETIVILCQVPSGFTRNVQQSIASTFKGSVVYQVETLIFGRAVERAMKPERYIVGSFSPEIPKALREYLEAFQCPILVMKPESAELAKIAINLFLISSLTTTAALAELCEKSAAVWGEIVPALRLDKRIGEHAYLTPGLGIAGGNLERDLATVRSLAAEKGSDASVFEGWTRNLAYRREWLVREVARNLPASEAAPPLVALWGLAYKAGTNSLKNSPAVHLIESAPHIRFRAYDPVVKDVPFKNVTMAADAAEACVGAELLVVATPWEEFKGCAPALVKLKRKTVLDPFRTLGASAGCRVITLGERA